jgi:hypothetical protein
VRRDRGGKGELKSCTAPGSTGGPHKRPAWDSTIDRLMGSPIPVPLSLVVKNALKLSLTEISSWLSLVSDVGVYIAGRLVAAKLLKAFARHRPILV